MIIHDENNNLEQEVCEDHDSVSEGAQESVDVGDHEFIECQKEVERWKEKCMRVTADLENINRRMGKERESWIRTAQVGIFSQLLTVVDNFERALSEKKSEEKDSFSEGISLIYKELLSLLDRSDVKEITKIDIFDPELHEALVQVDSDTHESGAIVDVLQKGYLLKDRVLRPAKVSVAK